MRRLLPTIVSATCLWIAGAAHVNAQTINVFADQARILPLPGNPATMFIGNPMIADVSVQNGVMAIQGRQFGTTNLIILDHDGREVANYEINVQNGGGQMMQVYRAGARMSYNCQPVCESIAVPGDDPGYMSGVLSQISAKSGAALASAGQATQNAAAAPAVVNPTRSTATTSLEQSVDFLSSNE